MSAAAGLPKEAEDDSKVSEKEGAGSSSKDESDEKAVKKPFQR
jgi:hypothetical protein